MKNEVKPPYTFYILHIRLSACLILSRYFTSGGLSSHLCTVMTGLGEPLTENTKP